MPRSDTQGILLGVDGASQPRRRGLVGPCSSPVGWQQLPAPLTTPQWCDSCKAAMAWVPELLLFSQKPGIFSLSIHPYCYRNYINNFRGYLNSGHMCSKCGEWLQSWQDKTRISHHQMNCPHCNKLLSVQVISIISSLATLLITGNKILSVVERVAFSKYEVYAHTKVKTHVHQQTRVPRPEG